MVWWLYKLRHKHTHTHIHTHIHTYTHTHIHTYTHTHIHTYTHTHIHTYKREMTSEHPNSVCDSINQDEYLLNNNVMNTHSTHIHLIVLLLWIDVKSSYHTHTHTYIHTHTHTHTHTYILTSVYHTPSCHVSDMSADATWSVSGCTLLLSLSLFLY